MGAHPKRIRTNIWTAMRHVPSAYEMACFSLRNPLLHPAVSLLHRVHSTELLSSTIGSIPRSSPTNVRRRSFPILGERFLCVA